MFSSVGGGGGGIARNCDEDLSAPSDPVSR